MQITSTTGAPTANAGTDQSDGGFQGAPTAGGTAAPHRGITRTNPIAPPMQSGGRIGAPIASTGFEQPGGNPIAPPTQSSSVRALTAQAGTGESGNKFQPLIVFGGPALERAEAQLASQEAALAAFDAQQGQTSSTPTPSPSQPAAAAPEAPAADDANVATPETPGVSEQPATAVAPGTRGKRPVQPDGPAPSVTTKTVPDPNMITGTDASDKRTGTAGDDEISGLGGDDTLRGGAGDDLIFGGAGDDTLHSGSGANSLFGEDGDDTVVIDGDSGIGRTHVAEGGAGNDELIIEGDEANWATGPEGPNGGTLYERKDGGSSVQAFDFETVSFRAKADAAATRDVSEQPVAAAPEAPAADDANVATPETPGTEEKPVGSSGNDRFDSGSSSGEDHIVGSGDASTLSGGDGNDSISGQGGDDILNGDAGDDVLSGGEGHDRLRGGDGADTLYSGDGDDLLVGGDGDDTVVIDGSGLNAAVGGEGHDTLVLEGAEGDWTATEQEDGSVFYTRNGQEGTTNVTATGFEDVTYTAGRADREGG